MKKIIITICSVCFLLVSGQTQELQRNMITATGGFGFTDDSYTIQSFSIGYQRELTGKLYVIGELTNVQGSQSFESIFGERPVINEYGEFGTYRISTDENASLFGKIIDVRVLSLGLKKYIQVSPKSYMAGSLSVATSSISEMEMSELEYDGDGNIIYENLHPLYGTYQKFGARVGLEAHHFIAKKVGLTAKAEYLSTLAIGRISIGTSITF